MSIHISDRSQEPNIALRNLDINHYYCCYCYYYDVVLGGEKIKFRFATNWICMHRYAHNTYELNIFINIMRILHISCIYWYSQYQYTHIQYTHKSIPSFFNLTLEETLDMIITHIYMRIHWHVEYRRRWWNICLKDEGSVIT